MTQTISASSSRKNFVLPVLAEMSDATVWQLPPERLAAFRAFLMSYVTPEAAAEFDDQYQAMIDTGKRYQLSLLLSYIKQGKP